MSVVVPTFNRADVTPRAVASVLAQTLEDLEVVVVDDGSTDGTADALAAIDDERLSVLRLERSGAAAARNAGAAKATGRWLTFLDSDDTVRPTWLATMVGAAEAANAVLVSCAVVERDEATGELGRVHRPRDLGPPFGGVTALVTTGGSYLLDRELFAEVGGFDPEQQAAQHTELALRLLPEIRARGLVSVAVDDALVVRHVGRADHVRRDDAAVYAGGRRILDKHLDALARDPARLADSAASAAFRAFRLGRTAEARRLLVQAVRANPRNPRHWARLAVTLVPPVGRRLWGRRP